MKRLTCLLLAVIMLSLSLFVFPAKANAATSGYYTYEVSNGEVTIISVSDEISGVITIPSTLGGYPVTAIGDGAFLNCLYLTGVTIPNSVTSIGRMPFIGCMQLTSIHVDAKNTHYCVDSFGALYNKNKTLLIQMPGGYSGHYTIPNSVTSISFGAFACCVNMTGVTIPGSVTSIGDYTFAACMQLTNIKVDAGNSRYCHDSAGALYSKDKTVFMQLPGAYSGTYTIPNGVTSVGSAAFACCINLTGVTIPNSVTSIGDHAFLTCIGLTDVTMGKGVTSVGKDIFSGCASLQNIYYTGSQEDLEVDFGDLMPGTVHYNSFPDVKSNAWYYNAVKFAVEKGYFSGNDDGTFAPGKNITRQDFVVVLSRIAGANLSQYSGKTNFADVPSNAYYAKAIHWATENGIIAGYNASQFGVGDSLTREQLVTILSRYAQKNGVNVNPTAAAINKMNTYSDANKINPYMKNAIAWALQNRVINGMTDTTIAPQGNATRAQVAAILMNINAYGVIPGI